MEDDEVASTSSDESLDAKSDKFDPLKALYSKKIKIPIKNVKIYDNISKYETFTKGVSCEFYKESRKENAELADPIKRRFLPHQAPIPSGSQSSGDQKGHGGRGRGRGRREGVGGEIYEKNVLTMMKGALGPLEMLVRCMEYRIRVKVYTRGACGIRGYILAYIAAFDKHWNLALEDCLEVWTRKIKRKAPALGIPNRQEEEKIRVVKEECKLIIKKSDGKTETVERHVPQLMVRGEQIAVIIKID